MLIDGIHRVYDAKQRHTTLMNAIVVDDVDAKLPAGPVKAFNPNILAGKRAREDRYIDYDDLAFRPIRKALESGEWTKPG